jgi:hypothetical protein
MGRNKGKREIWRTLGVLLGSPKRRDNRYLKNIHVLVISKKDLKVRYWEFYGVPENET